MRRDLVSLALALSAVVVLALSILPALADPPPAQIVKPFAQCDDKVCTITKEDWETLTEFHEIKFREISQANEFIDAARAEIEALRRMLARYAGGCGGRKT